MHTPLRRFVPGILLVSLAATLAGCADSRRGPTSPSAAALPTRSIGWECGRQSASTSGGGWSFPPAADSCPVTAAISPDAGIGMIAAAPGNFRAAVSATTVRLDWEAVPDAVSFLIEAGSAATLADLARLNSGNPAPSLIVNNVPTGEYLRPRAGDRRRRPGRPAVQRDRRPRRPARRVRGRTAAADCIHRAGRRQSGSSLMACACGRRPGRILYRRGRLRANAAEHGRVRYRGLGDDTRRSGAHRRVLRTHPRPERVRHRRRVERIRGRRRDGGTATAAANAAPRDVAASACNRRWWR